MASQHFPVNGVLLNPSTVDASYSSTMSEGLSSAPSKAHNNVKISHSPEQHSIDSLYTAGEGEMEYPFQDPCIHRNVIFRSTGRPLSRWGAKLQSSFDEEAPTFAPASSPTS